MVESYMEKTRENFNYKIGEGHLCAFYYQGKLNNKIKVLSLTQ